MYLVRYTYLENGFGRNASTKIFRSLWLNFLYSCSSYIMSQRGAIASKSAISVAESSTPRLIENDFFKAAKRQRPSGNDEENS